MVKSPDRLGGMGMRNVLTYTTQCPSVGSDLLSLIIVGCKPAAYLSSHNYCQLAEKYKLLVKLPFGIVGSVLYRLSLRIILRLCFT